VLGFSNAASGSADNEAVDDLRAYRQFMCRCARSLYVDVNPIVGGCGRKDSLRVRNLYEGRNGRSSSLETRASRAPGSFRTGGPAWRTDLLSPGRGLREMAGSTGLEPAASGVTGRRSNQLNYDPVIELTMKV
jgi:hypothetical protein